MAHDIFDFNDGWDQDESEHGELIDLERDAEKQRQELLAEQWRNGELFVTTDYVLVYENPTDPSPIVEEFEPDTVILLSSLQDSTNYGGFRDVLLPIRGWIWTSVDEYDKAFHGASTMLNNVQTRETSTSMMRLANYAKRKLRKHKNKKEHSKKHSDENINKSTHDSVANNNDNYAKSDGEISNSDLYVNSKQRELKQKKKKLVINPPAYSDNEFSESSHELSSKYRRMNHQVTYNPAEIKKIERPLSLEELDKLKEEKFDIYNLKADSAGHIIGIENEIMKKQLSERKETITEIEEQESLTNKIIHSIYIRKSMYFIRSYSALLTFLYILKTGFFELWSC